MTPGTDPGAPAFPHLKRKLLWNTLVSTIVFVLFYFAYTYRLVSIEDLAALLGMSR
jgi:predicted secreted protein